jgi:hypothetical protein
VAAAPRILPLLYIGATVDFLLTAKRDLAAARRILARAINLHDLPEKITIDKSGVNLAAIESVKADTCADIQLRQCQYLNNIVEQDHRAIKWITRPMLGFKTFRCARIIIVSGQRWHLDAGTRYVRGRRPPSDLRLPAMREQLIDAAVHMGWQSCQHVLEIGPRIVAMQLRGLQQAHHDGGALSGQFTSGE